MPNNAVPQPIAYKLDATCAALAQHMQAIRNTGTAAVQAMSGCHLTPEQQTRIVAALKYAGTSPSKTGAIDA